MAVSTAPSFEQLLGVLGPDRDCAGDRYRDLHRRLVRFFEWEGGPEPQAHADEVIDRIERKIAGGERIADVSAYAYAVARFVLREVRKRSDREGVVHAQFAHVIERQRDAEADGDALEAVRGCLHHCLQALTPANRALILAYYAGEGHTIESRRQLAASL